MCKLSNFFKKPEPEEPEPILIPEEKKEKYALLVGINKYRPDLNCDLRGCVNDVENIRLRLINGFSFHPDDIRVLIDSRATKNNITDRLLWLVDRADSELVFHYSGHGSQVRDRDGDELEDGLDEILCPYDMDFDNPLTDDLLGAIFKNIPESSFLTCIVDACHSQSMTRNLSENKARYLRPPKDIRFRSDARIFHTKKIGSKAPVLNHVLMSGCKDNQYSADAFIDGKWQGALTSNLGKLLDPALTWADIYQQVVNSLSDNGFSQIPQLNGADLETRQIFGGV